MRRLAASGWFAVSGIPAAKKVTRCAPGGSGPNNIDSFYGQKFANLLEAEFSTFPDATASPTGVASILVTLPSKSVGNPELLETTRWTDKRRCRYRNTAIDLAASKVFFERVQGADVRPERSGFDDHANSNWPSRRGRPPTLPYFDQFIKARSGHDNDIDLLTAIEAHRNGVIASRPWRDQIPSQARRG